MTSALLDLAPGFSAPVLASQQVFRAVLDAMSQPGRPARLPAESLAVGCPPDLNGRTIGAALCALLLTLLDRDTPARWHGRLASGAARAWLRFHTGARDPGEQLPAFVIVHADDLDATVWHSVPCGDDERPQQGGTLIVVLADEARVIEAGTPPDGGSVRLRGPGIAHERWLLLDGVPGPFWSYRQALRSGYPRGFEVVFVQGDRLIALPRSTHLVVAA